MATTSASESLLPAKNSASFSDFSSGTIASSKCALFLARAYRKPCCA